MTRLRPAHSMSEKMIKVDHAGENGAVNIYRGQNAVTRLFNRQLREQLSEFQTHEEAHREIFRTYLADKGIRRCISYHACGFGGLTLGLITGLGGQRAIAATTYAVEHVVLAHLAHQIDYLRNADAAALDCVLRIYNDEKEHHDSAEVMIGARDWLTRVLIGVVKLSTEAVIRFGMR
jgi:3-demethoxyubiquinol 3-hydroxylase